MKRMILNLSESVGLKNSIHLINFKLFVIVFALLFVLAPVAWGQEIEWIRQFGSIGPADDLAEVVDANGNIYIAGETNGSLTDPPGNAGGSDAFVRKYDPDGNKVWTRQFGTESSDLAWGIAVDDEGVYVSGYTLGTLVGPSSAGGSDAFVRKYNTDGIEVWTLQFGTESNDYGHGISVDATGVYVTGYTNGTLGQSSAGLMDAFVRKYDLNGTEEPLWTSQFGTASDDYAYGISVDATGVYMSGYSKISFGDYDAFVCKYDTDGNWAWTRQFGTEKIDDRAYGISAYDTRVYVSGYTKGTLPDQTSAGVYDAFVRKYDPDGNEVWTRQFGTASHDNAYGISADATGVYVAGYTLGSFDGQSNAGLMDAFVRKYDTDGNELWTSQFGTGEDDRAYGISVGATGVYVAGYTRGNLDGQSSPSVWWDAFVAKLMRGGNQPPLVDANGPFDVDEGGSVDISASGSDPDNDPLTFAWDLDNDGNFETLGQNVTFSAAGLDGPGSQLIIVKVTDSGGLFATNQTTVEILNVAPTVGEISAPIDPVPVNTEINASADFTDPGVPDIHTATWDWGDGSDLTIIEITDGSRSVSGSHIYTVAGDYSITLTITDDEGGTSQSIFQFVVIFEPNEPPVVVADGPFNVKEGGSVLVTASGNDPDNDPLSFAWDLDNDGLFETPGQSATFSAAGLDGPGSQTIAVKVTDSGGLFATNQTTVEILNVAPTVGEISAPIDPVQVDTEINTSAYFTDPGVLDTHEANWDWGDGNISLGIVNEADGSGTVTGTHTYDSAGVYTVNLIVWDNDIDADTSVFQYIVVFDPSAGYVTGAGWIESPEGAYPSEPSFTGKAKFGFVSKYKKGQSTPDGNTRFNFKTADLKFQSASYDWLVIAGPHAKYKGSGTINEDGDYGFMLTAVDGDVNGGGGIDKFRIKIWDKATDQVVYDNQLGDPDDGDATDAIEAGSIVIHQEAGLPKSDHFAEDIEPEAKPDQFALFQNYPNPFNPETMIRFQIPQANHVIMRIFNTLGVEIRKVVNARYEAGNYSFIWDGRDNSGKPVSSGTYIYQIQAGQFVDIKKMVLIR